MFSGIFFGRGDTSKVERDLPVTRLGRHALCAKDCYTDGGAMAFACGHVRNRARLFGEFEKSGITPNAGFGLSAIVLAAYRLWGEDFPSKLEGRVTAAVIDVDASRLVLARDRLGEGVIYYARKASSVVFSDEFDRVLNAPFVRREVGKTGLCELFALGPASTPGLTAVDDVLSLKPGHALVADCRGQSERKYFGLDEEMCSDGEDVAREKIRNLVEDSLNECLNRDPAVMLSGGLDSSILAYIMSGRRKQVRAWTVEYEDNELYYRQNSYQHDPDDKFVDIACAEIGARKNVAKITPDELALSLVEAGRARGFPGMGDIDASLLLFAKSMSFSETHALSGECADEVFGGYPWFHENSLLSMDGFPWSGSMDLRESVLSKKTKELINIRQYEAKRYHEAVAGKKRLRGVSETENRLRLTHELCFEWFMPVLQLRADKMCSAVGVTVMTPFCDDRLAKYAYSLPWDVKNARGMPKGILRLAFEDILPKEILYRRKSPYPKTHHPMYAKIVSSMMEDILNDPAQPINQICDESGIRTIMSGPPDANGLPWFGQLMTGAQLIAYLIQVNAFLRDNGLGLSL